MLRNCLSFVMSSKFSSTSFTLKQTTTPYSSFLFLITDNDFISSTTTDVPGEVKKWVTNLGRVKTQTSCISGTTYVFPNVCFLDRCSFCVRTVRVWMGQVKEEIFLVRMTFRLFLLFKTPWGNLHFAPLRIVSLWNICDIQNPRLYCIQLTYLWLLLVHF